MSRVRSHLKDLSARFIHALLHALLTQKERPLFLILFVMSMIYTSNIWMNNDFYADDLNRSMIGYGFNEGGRIFASAILCFLSAGFPLLDISPLPLFLGLISLCYCLTLYARQYLSEVSSLPIKAMSLFAFIANPFLIHNFSYKYDSLSMSLSLAVILLIFSCKTDKKWRSTALIFLSLGFYQASVHLFLILAIIEWIYSLYQHQKTVKKATVAFVIRIAEFLIATLSYLLLSKIFISSDYGMIHSQVNFDPPTLLVLITSNIESYFYLLSLCFLSTPVIVSLIFLFAVIKFLSKIIKKMPTASLKTRRLIWISPLLMILASFLCLTFLKNPIVLPRVLTSFSGVTLFFGLCFAYLSQEKPYWTLLITPFIGFSFIYAFAYGNGLKAQHHYEYFIDDQIATQISDLNLKISTISVQGNTPVANQTLLLSLRLPLLVPMILNSGWSAWQISTRLENDGIVYIREKQKSLKDFDQPPVFSNRFFSLYQKNQDLLILFKNEPQPLDSSAVKDPRAFLSQRIQTSW